MKVAFFMLGLLAMVFSPAWAEAGEASPAGAPRLAADMIDKSLQDLIDQADIHLVDAPKVAGATPDNAGYGQNPPPVWYPGMGRWPGWRDYDRRRMPR